MLEMVLAMSMLAVDGDSIRTGPIRYRLGCIDAPEKAQPLGEQSRAYLEKLLPKIQRTQVIDTDRYGRPVALFFLGDKLLQTQLVRAGMAYVYLRYQDGCPTESLLKAQEAARRQRLGVWANPNAIKPWDYRRGQR